MEKKYGGLDSETLSLLNKLKNVNVVGRDPAEVKMTPEEVEAFRAVDREMENPQLMAEYWANQRYLDKELKPSKIETIKKIATQDKPKLKEKVKDVYGGMTSDVNQSRELDPFLTAIAPNQSYVQQDDDGIRKGMEDDEFNRQESGYATRNTLSKEALARLLSGNLVSSFGDIPLEDEDARNMLLAGGSALGAGMALEKGLPALKKAFYSPSVDKARSASDFQYMNPKAQPIVESPLYKQGLPDVIEQSYPKLEMMKDGRELIRDRVSPYQRNLELQPIEGRDLVRERVAPYQRNLDVPGLQQEMTQVKSYGSNPASKLNVGPGGNSDIPGQAVKFKGFPKSPSTFVPNIPQGEAIGQSLGQKSSASFLKDFLQNRAGGIVSKAAPVLKGLSALSPNIPQEDMDSWTKSVEQDLNDRKEAALLAKHTKMTYEEALNRVKAHKSIE